MSNAEEPVDIQIVGPDDHRLVVAAREMGDRFQRTLGLLPYPVYDEAASRGCLLAAVAGDLLVGYVLYRTPRSEVAITQLCVDPLWRGRGVSDRLMLAVSERHWDRLGIKVKCRTDYNLDGVWERLGFVRRGDVAGRSKHGSLLTVWWRDHGHPDLFSSESDEFQLRVAIDVNILSDLGRGNSKRNGAEDSRVLIAGELSASIELLVAPEAFTELDRVEDRERVRALKQEAAQYRTLTVNPGEVERVEAEILARIRMNPKRLRYGESAQDRSDLRHVAQAGTAGVDVFTTRDEGLINVLGTVANEILGIRVLSPTDVVLHLDELQRAANYQPKKLLGTAYTQAVAGPGAEADLARIANTAAGESHADLARIVRKIVAAGGRWQIVRDEKGRAAAAYSYRIEDDRLQVDFLRVRAGDLSSTLSRQLLFAFRRECWRNSCVEVRIVDGRASPAVSAAAELEDFRLTPAGLSCLVIDVVGAADDVGRAVASAAQRWGIRDLPELVPGMAARPAARIEKSIWPAKLLDSDLRNFVVPIQARWSSELFGWPEGLFDRGSELGMSIEHVYYRSAAGRGVSAPGRVIWYVAAHQGNEGSIIAASLLDDIVEGSPNSLFERFSHLGVYALRDVHRAAKVRGVAQALRFSRTEIFDAPVGLRTYQSIAKRHGVGLFLQAPQQVPSGVFAEVWAAGRGQTVRP